MTGEARSAAFLLSEATVMIGPLASLWDLNPATHSIGLVKNFTMASNPAFTELTQGVKNSVVYSVLTRNQVTCGMEVYEFTAKNMAYGLGLDGSGMTLMPTGYSLKSAINGSSAPGVTAATFDTDSDVTGNFDAGDWIAIQHPTLLDTVHIAKLSADATQTGTGTLTHTLNFTGFGVKTGVSFPAGSKIYKVTRLEVANGLQPPFLAAKVVGILPEESRPITLIVPKMKITKGFNLAFTSQNFGNLPFEFTPYDLLPADPNYSEFQNRGLAALFPGS